MIGWQGDLDLNINEKPFLQLYCNNSQCVMADEHFFPTPCIGLQGRPTKKSFKQKFSVDICTVLVD